MDFLYPAPLRFASAAFYAESRMKFIDPKKPHRKFRGIGNPSIRGQAGNQIRPRRVPPMSRVAPVMNLANGETRKAIACATSSGCPMPRGI
jgi:hypothetical protein